MRKLAVDGRNFASKTEHQFSNVSCFVTPPRPPNSMLSCGTDRRADKNGLFFRSRLALEQAYNNNIEFGGEGGEEETANAERTFCSQTPVCRSTAGWTCIVMMRQERNEGRRHSRDGDNYTDTEASTTDRSDDACITANTATTNRHPKSNTRKSNDTVPHTCVCACAVMCIYSCVSVSRWAHAGHEGSQGTL